MNSTAQADQQWLLRAIELSRRCSPIGTSYRVGAIIVSGAGKQLADGYSRENDPHVHAEESALAKLERRWRCPNLADATMYSSIEPCSSRKSRSRSCTELILATGIRRVVYAMREPPLFVECHGVELLRAGGVEVIEIADLADLVRDINSHVLSAHRK